MACVDLSPIRARLAETRESSECTAIAERLAELRGAKAPASRRGLARARPGRDAGAVPAAGGMICSQIPRNEDTRLRPLVIRHFERRLTAAL
jgi:hypothetical protein